MISNAPILKHQTFFLRELTHFQRIQPVPDDLSILAHTVSIYWPTVEKLVHLTFITKKVYGKEKKYLVFPKGPRPPLEILTFLKQFLIFFLLPDVP